MKIYSFWSGDTTYFTTSRSIRKARLIGREVMAHYLMTCKYLGEAPEVGKDYFIPEEVMQVTVEEFRQFTKTDTDVMILDEALELLQKEERR